MIGVAGRVGGGGSGCSGGDSGTGSGGGEGDSGGFSGSCSIGCGGGGVTDISGGASGDSCGSSGGCNGGSSSGVVFNKLAVYFFCENSRKPEKISTVMNKRRQNNSIFDFDSLFCFKIPLSPSTSKTSDISTPLSSSLLAYH